MQLNTPPLEGMDICWYRVTPENIGLFRAKVSFHAPEVRQYDENFQVSREIELG